MPMRRIAWLLSAVVSTMAIVPARAAEPPVVVYAAASLKESLDAVAAAWQRRSGQKLRISYAATSALAQQIEQGAPADVLIAADAEWMDHLQRNNLIDAASRHDLLGNRLVLIAGRDTAPAAFDLTASDRWLAVLADGRLALAETTGVPAGRYARAALDRLGVWPALQPRLALSDSVRGALALVALGEAPLGIVYATDARAEPRVRALAAFPSHLHAPIVYPVARVAAQPAERSAALLGFLRGTEAAALFERAGFVILRAAVD
jgi:molybdate transport system substrate-binding protein